LLIVTEDALNADAARQQYPVRNNFGAYQVVEDHRKGSSTLFTLTYGDLRKDYSGACVPGWVEAETLKRNVRTPQGQKEVLSQKSVGWMKK
jgi:hypothetical protein